jgi:putative membrane protein
VSSSPPSRPPGDREPDYRFTLANERTFLAYIRTALGLDAAGLGSSQLVHADAAHLRVATAALLVVLGIGVAVLGYRRWLVTERAMRLGEPLPPVRLPLALGLGIVVVSLGALVLVIASR